jgi:putative SOS response-associated peptidase YedK
MCGRYGLYKDPSAVVKRLRARAAAATPLVPRYNIAPTAQVLAIVNTPERELREMRWGLLPRFAERSPVRRSTFNARIETLATSPLYGPLLPSQRCVVLADGYYEWPPQPGGIPAPTWIARRDGATIVFAGLYDADSVTIVTQPPNDTLARVHDRMPAALALDVADRWLTPAILTPQDALALLAPSDGNLWTYHRVGRAVGNARIDRPELIDPVNAESEPSDQLELFG